MLLALKGLPEGTSPRLAELAARLQIRHHNAVELADRLVRRGDRHNDKQLVGYLEPSAIMAVRGHRLKREHKPEPAWVALFS